MEDILSKLSLSDLDMLLESMYKVLAMLADEDDKADYKQIIETFEELREIKARYSIEI